MKYIHRFRRSIIGKIFLSLLGTVMVIFLLLFTPWGNRMMSPVVEKVLTSSLATPITVKEFILTPNHFHLSVQDGFGNRLSTQGGFSLLTLHLHGHYRILTLYKGGMNPLASPSRITGSFSGGMDTLTIRGSSDIFEGKAFYSLQLRKLSLSNIRITLTDIAYAPLLALAEYPSITDARITGEIHLRGFDRRDVEGSIQLTTKTSRFSPTPIQKDDNTSFDFRTLLADQNGRIHPFDINVTVALSLDETGILEQFIGYTLNGPAKLNGSLEGDETLLHLHAATDIARSRTDLSATLSRLEPSALTFKMRHADVEKLFNFFSLNAPILGACNAKGDINTSAGDFTIALTEGKTVPHILKKEYNLTQPLVHFNTAVSIKTDNDTIHYRGSFQSDLARLRLDGTTTHTQMLRDLLEIIR